MEVVVSKIRSDRDEVVKKTISVEAFDAMLDGYADHRAMTGLEVDLTFSRLQGEDILARGTLAGSVSGPCRRCLEGVEYPVRVDVVVTFVPAGRIARQDGDEVDLEVDDLDVLGYEDDVIELADLVRETVLLELMPFPPCAENRPECRELEATLERLAEPASDDGDEPAVDPRWAALAALKQSDSN